MTVTFRPAKLDKTPLLIGLAGPSGSGKTFSALRLAKGISGGGKVFMVDTEARRGLHYASMFDFQHGEMNAPFKPEAYQEAIQAAAKAGASVCIIDSTSHCHEGHGGILEQHETELTRMAGDDYRKRDQMKFAAWIEPKKAHNRFVNTILQTPMHLIFCFRAKDKLELKKIDGKLKPVQAGWQPICTDRFEYEMTMLLVLPPGAKGVPDLSEQATKIQEQHRAIIKPGQQLSEIMGSELAAWALGTPVVHSKAARGDAAANQAALPSGSESASHGTAKGSDPLFIWIDGKENPRQLASIAEWTSFVLAGVKKAKSAVELDDAFQRNGEVTHKLRLAGYGEAVDEILEELRNRMQVFNPLNAG